MNNKVINNNDTFGKFALSMTKEIEVEDRRDLFWFNSSDSSEKDCAYFMVLTSGNCGAIWFASALNLHEDILTGCGIDHPIESMYLYNLQKNAHTFVKNSIAEQYSHGIIPGETDFLKLLRNYGVTNSIITARDRFNLASYVFDELESISGNDPVHGKFNVIGTVHAFTATAFADAYSRDRNILKGRRVVACNMIRHPVPRAESYIKAFVIHHLNTYKSSIDSYIEKNLDECRRLERSYGISMEDPRIRSIIFTYRIGKSVQWVADELRKFKDMHTLKLENLQNDRDYFAKTVYLLTSGRIKANDDYLDKVFSPQNIVVGRRSRDLEGKLPPGPQRQWEEWTEFERAEFLKCFHDDRVGDAYKDYGYDFSFVH